MILFKDTTQWTYDAGKLEENWMLVNESSIIKVVETHPKGIKVYLNDETNFYTEHIPEYLKNKINEVL